MKVELKECPRCGSSQVKISQCSKVAICKKCRFRHGSTRQQIEQYGGDQIKAVIQTWNAMKRN